MAFTEDSKLYAVKVVDGKKLLFEATKDDVRKAPHVNMLPSASGSKRGLIYLYDDGSGEKGYICVKSGDDYEWLPLGGSGTAMSKEVYDRDGSVERAGGIKRFVSTNAMQKSVYDPGGYVSAEGGIENYVENRIVLPVQANWNQTNSYQKDFILNKPFFDNTTSSTRYAQSFTPDSTRYITTTNNETYYYSQYGSSPSSSFFSGSLRIELDGEYFDGMVPGYRNIYFNGSSLISVNSVTISSSFFVFYYNSRLYFAVPMLDGIVHQTAIGKFNGTFQKEPLKYIDLSSRERVANKVNVLNSLSSNVQYPSAKVVYDGLSGKENTSNKTTSISISSTNTQYPTAKAVWDLVSQSGGSTVDMGTISLGTSWSGSDPYTQSVTISGATVKTTSKVDIQPNAAAISQFTTDGVTAIWIENNNGVLSAKAMGGATTASLSIQCTVTEVV